ncbi:uncharacterized protein LOC100907462 [Galendromus occidentalis]|uniref:Uncharacterized protein LOC100907462 n=1 Tax=Galendromus occidentalis TaxID=34638 RepID=A0AAJ6VY14_9ACAR|nr:uncharacterized protein LOC100907462 [Galendromus occidentalis]
MARKRSQTRLLRQGCVKLFFFVLTFIAFAGLQSVLPYVRPAWGALQEGTAGVPGMVLVLAFLGVIPVVWIILLGVDQVLRRLCEGQKSPYALLSSDDDFEDVEFGTQSNVDFGEKPIRQKTARSPPEKPTGRRSAPRGGGRYDDDEGSDKNPTDVDVTVHPVDTTIAAGGEARVSPQYNVSLMSFANDSPRDENSKLFYPSAPSMLGGPAFFKRQF